MAGWVGWNMVLDQSGGPNWAKLTADAPVISNPEKKEYYKQPSFYGLGHFAKFIAPGSAHLEHNQSMQSDQLLITVAHRPDGGVVVVVLNTSDDTIEFNIEESGQKLSNVIKGHTIQTYIYYD